MEDFHKEFGWFIYGLLGIGALWFFTGGIYNYSAREPYIKPLAPLNSGETYGAYYSPESQSGKERLDLPDAPADIARDLGEAVKRLFSGGKNEKVSPASVLSPLSNSIAFDGVAGAEEPGPDSEYVRIVANPHMEGTVSLSGMRLDGSRVDGILLPQAANLLILGRQNTVSAIVLPPAGRALISTGKSPVGASFRVNICSGYLGHADTYAPELRQECPAPLDELRSAGPYQEEACRALVSSIPKCSSYSGTFPTEVSAACRAFVQEKLSYNSCAARHQNESGFYKDEWRLFLGQSVGLWDDSKDTVRLLDGQGRVIDAISI